MSLITKTNPNVRQPNKTEHQPYNSQNNINEEFYSVQKKFFKYAGGTSAAVILGTGALSFKYGWDIPAKVLRIVGNGFGAVAATLTPFILGKNEVNDFNILKHGKKSVSGSQLNNLNELFYRSLSAGFMPFTFESFINPKEIFRSKTSTIATVLNIPNFLFTSFFYGLGNLNSILAWGLTAKEEIKNQQLTIDSEKNPILKQDLVDSTNRLQSYKRLYSSLKRAATLGSISLPAMHGMKRWAESIDFFFRGEMSMREFFGQPFLALSRILSFGIGLPESIAKAYDSLARVIQEKEHLRPALPKFAMSFLDRFANKFESKVSSNQNNLLKSTRYAAEVIFHTLSPLSHVAFLSPLLSKPALNEEIQSQGGIAALANKVFGYYGKTLVNVFIGSYAFASRLPQGIVQSIYFGRYYYGKHVKGETDKESEAIARKIQTSICNLPIVRHISKLAHNTTKYLVEDFYEAEHLFSYPSFEDIQAKVSFEQAEKLFKDILHPGKEVSEEEKNLILDYCINFLKQNALKAYATVDESTINLVREKVNLKINQTINPSPKPQRRTNIKFPGANFLASFVSQFDWSNRLGKLDPRSPFHRMETGYHIDELPSFERELMVVLSECASSGLNDTISNSLALAA